MLSIGIVARFACTFGVVLERLLGVGSRSVERRMQGYRCLDAQAAVFLLTTLGIQIGGCRWVFGRGQGFKYR